MEPSYLQKYFTQSGLCLSWESVCGKCRKEILVCEVFFSQDYFKFIACENSKMCPKSVLKIATPDLSFAI